MEHERMKKESTARKAAGSGKNLLYHMGELFHADFSSVNVRRSDEPGKRGMAAFTEKGNIVLDHTVPPESSARGRQVLGHELSHVVQQAQGRVPHRFSTGSRYYWQKDLEEEANYWGQKAARDESVRTGPLLTLDTDSLADCPCQPMLLNIGRRQFDTDDQGQLQELEELLGTLPPDTWFALSEQLYRNGAARTEGGRRLQWALDARIVDWQRGLGPDDPEKFSGEDSKELREENPVSEPESLSVEGFPDIPLMGPTREGMPGKDAFPSRRELVDILAGKRWQQVLTYPVHRGEMETESVEIEGRVTPCVRIYLTVYNQTNDFDSEDPDKWIAQSEYKDIRQLSSGSDAGRIVISGGGHNNIYMNAGYPLRALQWADKYRAEGKPKPARPVIYSFLFPLERFNEITKEAINQKNKRDFPGRTVENSDYEAAPNQYLLPLDAIRSGAVPGTLVSYSEDPDSVKDGGITLHASDLRRRLGVPALTLRDPMWISGKGFRTGSEQKEYASRLSNYLLLWQKYLSGNAGEHFGERLFRDFPYPEKGHISNLKSFLRNNHLIPPGERDDRELNLNESQINRISWFVRNVAGPWASLGAAVGLVRDDYIHMSYDTEIGPESGRDTNNFGHQPRAQHAGEAGMRIDEMVQGNAPAVDIINYFLQMCPELIPAFEEISNRSEKYSFYNHAQLVLQKYMQLIQGEPEEGRILTHASVVKAILFHDLFKWSSRMQYTQEKQMEESAAEHYLPYLEMSTYGKLWGEERGQLRAARALVNGDPIGTFLKPGGDGQEQLDRALDAFAVMAESAGVGYGGYFQFFRELMQFYMADAASYTQTGDCVAEYGGDERKQATRTLNKVFDIEEGGGRLQEMEDKLLGIRRFKMAEEYEKKIAQMEGLLSHDKSEADMRNLIECCRQNIRDRKERDRRKCRK